MLKKLFKKKDPEILGAYGKPLPEAFLLFLKNNPNGSGFTFNEYDNETQDDEGTYWTIMSEKDLLYSWEMNDVGVARNFECLKLYVAVQKEFNETGNTSSNIGDISLDRVQNGFVFAEGDGDYLYFDSSDANSVWIYYHDGGDVLKIANSFSELAIKDM